MQDTSPNPMHTLPADQQASVLPEQRSASKKGMWVVIVIVLLIAVGVGGYWFGVESSKLEQDPEPPAVAVEPTAIPGTNNVACTEDARVCPDGSSVGRIPPACEFAACPTTPEITPNQPSNTTGKRVYKLTLKSDKTDENKQPQFLTEYLPKLLDISLSSEQQSDNFILSTDTKNSSTVHKNKLNNEYYLATDLSIKVGETSADGVNIRVKELSSSLVPYLLDAKYCQVDRDCGVRSNFCEIGAFNAYHRYYDVWGCEAPNYEGFEDENNPEVQASEGKICANYDVQYSGVKCVSNSCVALKPTITCK